MTDLTKFKPFFGKVIGDYHKDDPVHGVQGSTKYDSGTYYRGSTHYDGGAYYNGGGY